MTAGAVSPRRMVLDWSGHPDLTKRADYYSIGPFPRSYPVLGNPEGRVLVAVSPTILYDGIFVAGEEGSFNRALSLAAFNRDARTTTTLWTGQDPWHTRLLDLTKRGMVQDFLALTSLFFGWADGLHIDYFSAMAEPYDAWDRALAGLATGIRNRGQLVLGQQYHPTPPSTALNGQFWEQSPTSFGQTMESHADDVRNFRTLLKIADPARESLFVAEIREPERFPDWYLAQVNDWAIRNDIVLAFGRDAQSVGVT